MVKHNVEVRLLMSSVTPEEEVLRVGVTIKGALEIRMLAIELEIPCYDEESLNQIVDNEDLDQVINSCRENILDPHLRTKVDINVYRLGTFTKESRFSSSNVLQLRTTFDDNIVREQPDLLHKSFSIFEL